MPFNQRLDRAARLVEAYLAKMCEDAAAAGAPPRLVAGMEHATLGGGKRLRPFLVTECAALFGVTAQCAAGSGGSNACTPTPSCTTMPAMDNDDLRRGAPTVHKAFDDWTAILVGDALLTKAFEIVSDPATHADAGVRGVLACSLACAAGAGGMVGGQCLDLEADKLGQPPQPDAAHVQRLQAMKTGALIRYACEAGAILGCASPPRRQALALYGERLGAAFQIADDILDLEGDAARIGKATRKDAGKATLVSVLGVEAAKARLGTLEQDAIAALALFGPDADVLRHTARFVVERKS